MKYIYTLILFLLTLPLPAQQDAKAESILNKVAATYRQAEGISVSFGGTQAGNLLLKGKKFHLSTEDMEVWFDGNTQWSYLKQNNEVNISVPSPEELQTINPYFLLSDYKQGFDYRYKGTANHKGKQGQEIVLTPKNQQGIRYISLTINPENEPVYIQIGTTNGQQQEFIIHSCRKGVSLSDNTFVFDQRKHPNAEIIDLR